MRNIVAKTVCILLMLAANIYFLYNADNYFSSNPLSRGSSIAALICSVLSIIALSFSISDDIKKLKRIK